MTTIQEQPETRPVPAEYGGRWIAWNHDRTRIIASAKTGPAARQAAIDAGEPDPLLERAPRPDVRSLGGPFA